MSWPWYDYLRVLSAVLALIALYRVVRGAMARWSIYTPTDKDYLWGFGAMLFLITEGSIEAIFVDAPFGPRVVLTTIVAIVCFRASRTRFMEHIASDYIERNERDDQHP